jgi:4-methyl-5(b-hydroxyethyl)-thiazole monophosphate biosynthesis
LLQGRAATCYPGFEDQLTGATLAEGAVVVDGAVTTSRGPGTAMAFALELVRQLCGEAEAARLREGMLLS